MENCGQGIVVDRKSAVTLLKFYAWLFAKNWRQLPQLWGIAE